MAGVLRGLNEAAAETKAAEALETTPAQRMIKSDHPYGWSGPDRYIVPVEIEPYVPGAQPSSASSVGPVVSRFIFHEDGTVNRIATRQVLRKNVGQVLEEMNLPPAALPKGQVGMRKALPKHEQTGWQAEIGRSELGKILHDVSSNDHFLAIEAIPEIWRTSRYVKAEDGKTLGTLATHFFENQVKIGENFYHVDIKVKHYKNGKGYYYQHLRKIDEPGSHYKVLALEEEQAVQGLPGSYENITQTDDLVKAGKKGDDFGGEGGGGGSGGSTGGSSAGPSAISGAASQEAADHFYINFARIDAPEDVKNAMQFMADHYRDELNAARHGEKITFQQIQLNAEQENAWKLLAERRTGQPLNAEQSLAARNLWASSGQKLSELADLAVKAPTKENLFAFRKMEIHRASQNEVIAARTETARALGAWRIPAGPRALQLRHMEDMLGRIPGGQKTVLELADKVAKLSASGQAQALETLIEKSPWAITRDGAGASPAPLGRR